MKHTFRNEKPKTFEILPDGDYVLEVSKVETLISQGAKTRGSQVLEIEFKSVEHGTTFTDKLIAHPSCDWKIDLFVNSFGLAAKVGEDVDLEPENLMGRRGWCKVTTRNYDRSDGTKGQANQIAVFYTDKEKFPRNTATPEPVATESDQPDWY